MGRRGAARADGPGGSAFYAVALEEAKRVLRKQALERRRAARKAAGGEAGDAVAEKFFAAILLPSSAAVSGYWPFGEELDPRPLLYRLAGAGHACGLPVVVGRGSALVFRAWSPGTVLHEGAFGILIPPDDAPEVVPDLLLVPLLAFDRKGFRLGYGGGYFDRTLKALRGRGRIVAVGLAFAEQEVGAVPHGPRDQPLDWVITEREAIDMETA